MSNNKSAIGLSMWKGFSLSRQLASAKNASKLIGGATIGQLALVLASPALTRLYSPSEFGAFATYVAVLSLAAIISSLRLDIAITLARTDEEAFELTAMAGTVVVVFSCIIGTALGQAVPVLTSIPFLVTAWL